MSDTTTRFTDGLSETVELTTPVLPPPVPPDVPVIYEADKVVAYFDAAGKSVKRTLATWAKVWTPDKKGRSILTIISFTQKPASG